MSGTLTLCSSFLRCIGEICIQLHEVMTKLHFRMLGNASLEHGVEKNVEKNGFGLVEYSPRDIMDIQRYRQYRITWLLNNYSEYGFVTI